MDLTPMEVCIVLEFTFIHKILHHGSLSAILQSLEGHKLQAALHTLSTSRFMLMKRQKMVSIGQNGADCDLTGIHHIQNPVLLGLTHTQQAPQN